jgi:hypothetical protein
MTTLRSLLYPELEGFAPEARALALARARRQPLDWMELAGLGAGVVAAALLTPYGAEALAILGRLPAGAASFVVAVPLLALAAGPALWHRTRRALREELGGGARRALAGPALRP